MQEQLQQRQCSAQAQSPQVSDMQYLWDIYRYRHQICWNTTYKILGAVVILSAIPYADDKVAARLGGFMLAPAVLAMLLAVFGIWILRNELALFAKTKVAYHLLQNEFLGPRIADGKNMSRVVHEYPKNSERRTLFDLYMLGFMGAVAVSCAINVSFLILSPQWLPPTVAHAADSSWGSAMSPASGLELEVVKFGFNLVLAVVTASLGWFVGLRLTISWNLRQKRRELDLDIVQQLHAIYGEFKEVIKAWRLAMRGSQDFTFPSTLRWELLARACALEAKYETILIKMASERLLTHQDRAQLGLFRQALQQARECIRDGVEIAFASRGPDYVFFNALASAVTLIISNSPWSEDVTDRQASDNLFAIAAIRKPDLKRELDRFQKQHTELAADAAMRDG
jgi:hypothetical protein